MASNTINVKAQSYSTADAYKFRITANETDETEGSKRKIEITYDVYAKSPGGYQSFTSPKASIWVDGTKVKGDTTIKNIWPRGQWQTLLTHSMYVEGNETHTVKGRFNSNTSSYDYLPVNGNHDVSVDLEVSGTGAQLSRVDLASDFIESGKITPYFTDPVGSRYYGLILVTYSPMEIMISWNAPLYITTSGQQVTIPTENMKKIWDFLDRNNNTMNGMWGLYTYDSASHENIVGASESILVDNLCSLPSYNLQWASHTIEDANANVQYGGHPLSYYLNSGSFAKLLSKIKIAFSANSSVGSTFGKTITYKVNNNAATSPYTAASNFTGESYVIKANDGRASEISYTYSPTIVNYTNPYISNLSVVRPVPTQGKIKVSYTANYFNGSGMKNLSNATYNFYYRENSSDNWTKVSNLSGSGTSGSQSFSNVEITGLDPNKPFYYKIELADRIGNTISPSSYIPRGLPVWNVYTKSDGTNVFNVNGDETVSGHITATGRFRRDKAGSWIWDRDNASVRNNNDGNQGGYASVISQKTKNGNWTLGSYQDDCLIFDYTNDTDYSNGTNNGTRWKLPVRGQNLNSTENLALLAYPVGSIYMSVNNTNPGTIFGGSWTQLKDRFLLGAGDTYSNGSTGGEATHTLTVNEMPSHSHKYGYGSPKRAGDGTKWNTCADGGTANTSGSTGGGQAHNNMPPYLVVYMWKRTS